MQSPYFSPRKNCIQLDGSNPLPMPECLIHKEASLLGRSVDAVGNFWANMRAVRGDQFHISPELPSSPYTLPPR
ncbi:hypothetical protein ACRALDRAFT_211253 [Sodiomyces alcalophilus JCM 7366]|uniref:uncharacterized protein n=1 Tax=Sodiomyces alcalophilus JCM 7366 TaxID=591952 RepID=UPI0039B3A8EB